MSTTIGANPYQSNYVALITNTAGTVDLKVFDAYSRIASRDNGDYKSYDVLICTGSILTTTNTDWVITAEGETPGQQITPSADDAILTVDIAEQPAVLHVRLNGTVGIGRIQETASLCETWMSYRMWHPNQLVSMGNSTYVCTTKHLSILFDEDLAAGMWSVYQSQNPRYASQEIASASENAFEVFYFPNDKQSVECDNYQRDEISFDLFVPNLQSITCNWMQRNGQPFIFPHKGRVRLADLESTSAYTYERDYYTPTLHLQISSDKFYC
jgi:hypothetical protein